MSIGTTSISELPVADSSGPPANVNLQTSDTTNKVISNEAEQLSKQREQDDALQAQSNASPPNPQDYMKQVETDVQEAKRHGQLRLPERDIPRENTHITQDASTKANYIPEGPDDYIKRYQTNEVIQQVHQKREEKSKNIDFLYEELQTPILITLIYFFFQMPIVSSTLIKHIPKLFKNDGNLNTQGQLFKSLLFGCSYFLLMKAVNYIAE